MEILIKMINQEIDFIEKQYKVILSIENDLNKSEKSFKDHFKLSKKDEYQRRDNLNPFRYNESLEALGEIRDKFIRSIIFLIEEKYPNLQIESKDLDNCIKSTKNKHGYKIKSLEIDFSKVKQKVSKIINNADIDSQKEMLKQSLNLVPYSLKKVNYDEYRDFTKEELLNKRTLKLYCYCSYDFGKYKIAPFLKLVSVLLYNEIPSKAKPCEKVNYKSFKNGRLDITFNTEYDAIKIAEYLVKNQKV